MFVARALPLFCAIVGTALVCGCSARDFASILDDDQIPCDDVEGVDAGFCDPAEVAARDLDGGGPPAEGDTAIACEALRASACGASDECLRDPGCVAADLVARFEPERCAEAAGDARSFPPCELGNCTVLVDRVCGVGAIGACEDAPGCPPARELARRADGGDASADASCAQALADEALFPSCG